MTRAPTKRVGTALGCIAVATALLFVVGCNSAPRPEATDTAAPVVSGLSCSCTGDGCAVLTFTTDEPAGCHVQYGTTSAYGQTVADGIFCVDHSLTLTDLQPHQTYYVEATIYDEVGNSSGTSVVTFETPDTASPTPSPGVTPDETPSVPDGTLRVYVIDVGQGDAILLDYGDYEMLIDGGENNDCLGCLASHVDGALEVVLATHPHADHIGGLPAVFDTYDVEEIWHNGDSTSSQIFGTFTSKMDAEGAGIHKAERGDTISLGNLTLDVLHPAPSLCDDCNNNSIVLALHFGEVDFLFTGDAEKEAESEMASLGILPDVDILKVGHHGSDTSSCSSFLSCVEPEVAIYSAGEGNRYGHPCADTLSRLSACGAEVYGTDVNGTVVITTDGTTYEVSFEEGSAVPPTIPADDDDEDEAADDNDQEPTPPSGDGDVVITKIYYDGQVARVESDEYVEITNTGGSSVNLKNWVLKDIADGSPSFTFPSYDLEPGDVIRVYTDEIHSESGGFSFGSGSAIWANSDPDTAGLFDDSGDLVSQKSY